MNNIKQLKDSQREAHPGFDSYLECMTRSLFTGLSAFVLSKLFVICVLGVKNIKFDSLQRSLEHISVRNWWLKGCLILRNHLYLWRLCSPSLVHIKLLKIEPTAARQLGWQ